MIWQRYLDWEKKVSLFFQSRSISFLRFSMGLIYLWYGSLKIFQFDPNEIDFLIRSSTDWIGLPYLVEVIGIWEVFIGVCFLWKRFLRWGLLLFFFHFPGTLLPLFLSPETAFSTPPFALTIEGKYICKNIILLASAFVLVSSLHRVEPREPIS